MAQILGDDVPERGESSLDEVALKPEVGKALAAVEPYLEITACGKHLMMAAEECFRGTFEYHETGKDALHARAHDHTLLEVTHRHVGDMNFSFKPSMNALHFAVASHASGQKHRSIVHQSCGRRSDASAGTIASKSSTPSPNGTCADVSSFPSASLWHVLSESIK